MSIYQRLEETNNTQPEILADPEAVRTKLRVVINSWLKSIEPKKDQKNQTPFEKNYDQNIKDAIPQIKKLTEQILDKQKDHKYLIELSNAANRYDFVSKLVVIMQQIVLGESKTKFFLYHEHHQALIEAARNIYPADEYQIGIIWS
ncbi:MAG TPA: hypothetical protein VK203_02350 [Nostocaceae cyanobacterium]|nr:hypothetical protein [Nostocaceae cyanobacterium]